MQVICVTLEFATNREMPKLEIGTLYTVVSEKQNNGRRYFMLAELQDEIFDYWYNQKCFALIPEQTASELYEEELEAIIM